MKYVKEYISEAIVKGKLKQYDNTSNYGKPIKSQSELLNLKDEDYITIEYDSYKPDYCIVDASDIHIDKRNKNVTWVLCKIIVTPEYGGGSKYDCLENEQARINLNYAKCHYSTKEEIDNIINKYYNYNK